MANLTLTYGSLNLTATPYMLEFGANFGAPENVTNALALLLQDGEVELTDRTSNRTVEFHVLIEGDDLGDIAMAEAALMAEANKPRNTLTLDPGDSGPATTYDTFRAQVRWERDDTMDMQRLRRYSVTIKAAPAGRSAAEVSVAALPASGTTTTLVDNGSATTNWTGTINGSGSSPSVVSGAVGLTSSSVSGDTTLSLTRTASITTSSTKLLVVDYKPTTGGYIRPHQAGDLTAFGDGVALTRLATVALAGGIWRATYYVAAASVAVLRLDLRVHGFPPIASQVRTFFVDNINRTDIRPSIGTTRQQQRTIPIAGSAPGLGDVTLSHASNALGDAMIYAWPSPEAGDAPTTYSPPLSQYANSARTTAATNVSGNLDVVPAGTSRNFDVPMTGLPQGSYLVLSRAAAVSGSFSGDIQASAVTFVGGATQVDSVSTANTNVAFTTTYAVYVMGRLQLPLMDVLDPNAGTVRVSFRNNTAASVNLDEMWLFDSTIGQFIWVKCQTASPSSGGPSRRVVVRSASVEKPRPSVLQGFATDNSDARFDGIQAWSQLRLTPPEVNLFTVTTNTADADCVFTHYPRWELNAAS